MTLHYSEICVVCSNWNHIHFHFVLFWNLCIHYYIHHSKYIQSHFVRILNIQLSNLKIIISLCTKSWWNYLSNRINSDWNRIKHKTFNSVGLPVQNRISSKQELGHQSCYQLDKGNHWIKTRWSCYRVKLNRENWELTGHSQYSHQICMTLHHSEICVVCNNWIVLYSMVKFIKKNT